MKNVTLKLAVLATFGVLSSQVMATGLVSLPTAGFTVAAGTNQVAGTTGWLECNTTGNYGSGEYIPPTASLNNNCAVFPSGGNNPGTPVSGFTSVSLSAAKQSVTVTANGETLATMRQRVYRNSAATECVFEKRLVMAQTGTFDYNPQFPGSNRLEVNDFTLGGFSATPTVSAGYYHSSNTDSPIYRLGRAFTSVQIQANPADETQIASGFVRRPVNIPAPAASTEINGVGQTPNETGANSPGSVVPTAAQQTSAIRTNWVDFVVDTTGGVDEDGTTSKDSPFMYVRAACGSGGESTAFPTVANTVRIRQTGQETQPFITVLTSGITRSGANANF